MKNIIELVEQGHQSFADNIKILLYNYDKEIFSKLDFEEEKIYTDPLFFAIFNNNKWKPFTEEDKQFLLSALVFGYANNLSYKEKGIFVHTDKYGRIFIPNKGWVITSEKNQIIQIKEVNGIIETSKDNKIIYHQIIPITILQGTSIELLEYPHELFEQFFSRKIYADIDFEEKAKYHKKNLEHALSIISRHCPEHFNLINTVMHKLVVFNISPEWTNSFMSRSAYGAAFFNTYQDHYDEIFLIDDIAHQTGHVIFEALIYERERFFRDNHLTIIETNQYEDRTIEVFLHALFTYHLILSSLSACLENNVFDNRKKHKLEGRLLHSLLKCKSDLQKIDRHKAVKYFTAEGLEIYDMIVNTYNEAASKWAYLFRKYSLQGQPYNFTYSVFLEKNPIHDNISV